MQCGCVLGAAMEVALLECVVCSPCALHRECVLGMLLALQQCAHPASVRHPHSSQVISVTLLVQCNMRGFIGCSIVTR